MGERTALHSDRASPPPTPVWLQEAATCSTGWSSQPLPCLPVSLLELLYPSVPYTQ